MGIINIYITWKNVSKWIKINAMLSKLGKWYDSFIYRRIKSIINWDLKGLSS